MTRRSSPSTWGPSRSRASSDMRNVGHRRSSLASAPEARPGGRIGSSSPSTPRAFTSSIRRRGSGSTTRTPPTSEGGTEMRDLGTRHRRYFRSVAVVSVLAFVAIACTQGSSNNSSQQPSNQPQTIVFATQGLGSEGSATKAAITAFEAANPSITVQVQTLSPTANTAQQQLTQRFVAGDTTPDVITADVIWPAAFAKAGWLAPLDGFGPSLDSFFPGQVQSGQYGGHTYAIPWFINAEGLYYRTDLVPSPPKTPMDVVTAAKQAMSNDPSIKDGLAFEGDKYEGLVTAYINFLGGFGGSLDPANLNTSQNQQA